MVYALKICRVPAVDLHTAFWRGPLRRATGYAFNSYEESYNWYGLELLSVWRTEVGILSSFTGEAIKKSNNHLHHESGLIRQLIYTAAGQQARGSQILTRHVIIKQDISLIQCQGYLRPSMCERYERYYDGAPNLVIFDGIESARLTCGRLDPHGLDMERLVAQGHPQSDCR